MKKIATIVAALFISIFLTACGESGGTQADPAAPADSVESETPAATGGPGTYNWEFNGATGTIELPGTGDNAVVQEEEALQRLEALREKAGAAPVYYVRATVDNTNGDGNINMYALEVITEDGDTLSSTALEDLAVLWTEDGDSDLYNEGVAVYNELIASNSFSPGAKGTAFWAFEKPITSIGRVYVYPAGGMDQVEAIKAE